MSEPASLILSLIGPDRPGLVEQLARTIAEHGGNWVESRMCRLGGQFAGIVRIEVAAAAALGRALQILEAEGFQIGQVREPTVARQATGKLAEISVVGQDRRGIIREIAAALAARRVSVEELQTSCESAPMSAERLFRARFRVRIPAGVSVAGLRRDLTRVEDDLVADIAFEPQE